MTHWIAIDPAFSKSNYIGVAIGGGERLLDVIATDVITLSKPTRGIRKKSKGADDIAGIEHVVRSIENIRDKSGVQPDQLLIEWSGGVQNATAASALAIAKGMFVTMAFMRGWDLFFLSPFAVKKAMTGNRFATKEEVIAAVLEFHPVVLDPWSKNQKKREAVADAVAVSLAVHHHQAGFMYHTGEPYE